MAPRSGAPEAAGGATWLLILGCLLCQLALGYGYVFGPLAGEIMADFGWSRAQYSGAGAPMLFLQAAASPLVGVLAVRYGARPILATSAVVVGVVFLSMSQMQAIWQLYALRMALGLALVGLGDITVGQVVTQRVKRRQGLALGLVYTGSNLAGAVLVPLMVDLAEQETWRTALFTMGILAFAVILPAGGLMVRPAKRSLETLPASGSTEGASGEARDDDALDLLAALQTRSFWILAFSLFTFFAYFVGMLEHLVLFLTDEGMPRSDATWYYSRALLCGLFSKILLGAIADLVPRRSAILFDYGVLAGSSALLLLLPDATLILPFVVCFGFSTAARDVVYPMIISHCFGVRNMAAIYGALMLALLPGGAGGPLFAGLLHDRLGSYDLAFSTFATLNLVAFAGLFLVRDERGRSFG